MKSVINTMLLCLFTLLMSTNAKAQNKSKKLNDVGRIVLNSYVSNQVEGLPSSAKRMLHNKLSQIASKNGMGGSAYNPRFIITPNITVLTKDITATAPPMTALTLEVTFYIGDGIDGTLFANTSLEVKGVGTNETKAYISALKQIKYGHPELKRLIEEGKTKIIEYYNSQCDFILKEAETLKSQNEYDAAIVKLSSVPDVCKECYDKCLDAIAPIYQAKIDKECIIKLTKAKNAWSAGQDVKAANSAGLLLKGINPKAACFKDAESLNSQIAKRIKALDQREWDLKLKKQQDNIDIKKATIKAVRDVGVAYGKNQPKTVIYNTRSWW